MNDTPIYTVDDESMDESEWVEISRLEAVQRLENMLTEDLVAFEIDAQADDTPVGAVATYTWIKIDENDDQLPALLALRDPSKPEAPLRWFIHRDLVAD